jgi:hypothetical protein
MARPEAQVQLAVAGDLVEDTEGVNHQCTKAGGKPIFPGENPLLSPSELLCSICKQFLSLIVQVSLFSSSNLLLLVKLKE